MENLVKYWSWFFKGSGGKAGFKRVFNKWLLFLHLPIGVILALLIKQDIAQSANTVLLPLIGVFIGLSFAWASNAQSLMQTDEIAELSKHHEGGFIEYVYTYQTAILTIIATLVFWALTGLSFFNEHFSSSKIIFFIIKTFLYLLCSLTIRECWQVVYGSQLLLLSQYRIKSKNK